MPHVSLHKTSCTALTGQSFPQGPTVKPKAKGVCATAVSELPTADGEALTAHHEARVAHPPRPSSLVPRRTPTVDSHTPNGRLQTGIDYIQSLLCLQGLSTDPLITGDCVAKNLRDPVSQPTRKKTGASGRI